MKNPSLMQKPEKVFIANDHAGFLLKKFLIQRHPDQNWEDLGAFNEEASHYPEHASALCQKLLKEGDTDGKARFGVLVCGSGQGMAIKANRFANIRAVCAWSEQSARLSREHNNAQVLCLGARLIPFETADRIFTVFISTPFAGGRHAERVKSLN